MKISRADAPSRTVDDALKISLLFDQADRDFKFGLALGVLDGDHGSRINRVSDRMYFILSGSFQVRVGDEIHEGNAHDTFVIPAGVPHGIDGNGEFLVITSPPFAPESEEPA